MMIGAEHNNNNAYIVCGENHMGLQKQNLELFSSESENNS